MLLPAKNKYRITEIIIALLVFLFVYTSLSKLADISFFSHQLKWFPYIGKFAVIIAWMVPFSELAISVMLCIPKFQQYGLLASTLLLSVFTVYLFAMLAFHRQDLPCSCGGVIKYLSWKQHIFFNLVFIILTISGIINLRKMKLNEISLS
ncbi:MAG TPA: MauE/DoxX family redox-associated membrane protein [Puia sp.]|nr:MauE/DoxX family redox-associated membrane protein [Puia sp.]